MASEDRTPSLRRLLADYPAIRRHEEDLWSAAAGVAAFYSTLFASTLTQQRILGVTTSSAPPLPTALGVASVCLASWASHHAAVAMKKYRRHGDWPHWSSSRHLLSSSPVDPWSSIIRKQQRSIDVAGMFQIPLQSLRICCLGMITFKLLGGRFWSIAPSSYTHVGSFARVLGGSIPATSRYATAAERLRMERLGKIIGCHTCGTHKLLTRDAFRFVGDHQPPKAIAEQLNRRLHRRLLGWKVSYRFFPQCRDCSSIQGSILSKATLDLKAVKSRSAFFSTVRGGPSYFHGWRPRLYHWTGAVVGTMAVAGASDRALELGNSEKYDQVQQQILQYTASARDKLREWFCID